MSMQDIIKLSRRYGSNADFVVAGGGNTSYKEGDFLFVKASGFALADIDESGFAKMSLPKLKIISEKKYPDNPAKREQVALQDLMDARVEGEEKRPSVEALLHAILPQQYIVHTHPALVNGLTCSRNGEALTEELFGTIGVWVPIVNPGYILAKTVKDTVSRRKMETGKDPELIFLQNHGVFVMADSPEGITSLYDELWGTLTDKLRRKPDFNPVSGKDVPGAEARKILSESAEIQEKNILFAFNKEIASFCQSPEAFVPLVKPFTPDHIVYCGPAALYIPEDSQKQDVKRLYENYIQDFGKKPKTAVWEKLGFFSLGENEKSAATAMTMFLDAVKVAVYTESFGGFNPLPQDQIDFILNWEVEHYRAKVSLQKG